MTGLTQPPTWSAPSADPNDEQFGDVVVPTSLADVGEYEATIVGEPYDGAVIGRRGARDGPAAIREQLAATKTHHIDVGPVRSIADAGDIDLEDVWQPDTTENGDDVAAVQDAVATVTDRIYDTETLPVFLGGDNSLTYPNAEPLLRRGTVGAISFDAHLDCRAVRDGPTSGTPYRQLHEDGLAAHTVVGPRNFETSTRYHEYLTARDGHIIGPETVAQSPDEAAQRALSTMDDIEYIYVSIDLDVLEAAHAPGVSAPTPGGIPPRALFEMVRLVVADERVAGVEVVECAPPLDAGARTARVGARTVAHALAGRRQRSATTEGSK